VPTDDAAPPRPTPGYRDALRHAEHQAGRRGHQHLGVEHLLLGILDAGQSVATDVLAKYVDLPELRKATERAIASESYHRLPHPRQGDGPDAESTPVTLVRGDERQQAVIHWAWQGRSGHAEPYRAQLEWRGAPIEVGAGDMFEALVRIREQLEPQGWFVAVQGARLDTFASGMQRDMGGGLSVYVLRMGEPVRSEDVVETLAEADPRLLATVDAQRQRVAEWTRSVEGVGHGR
jgi:Clp amino terminal domain, pathogenicity island component